MPGWLLRIAVAYACGCRVVAPLWLSLEAVVIFFPSNDDLPESRARLRALQIFAPTRSTNLPVDRRRTIKDRGVAGLADHTGCIFLLACLLAGGFAWQ